MNYVSLCTGIGGFDLGLDQAGMNCAVQCEIDADAQVVLRQHYRDAVLHGDITTFTKEIVGGRVVDLVCAGTPCQDLSVAGRRAGLDGDRSRLFYEFVRIADELAARWVLWENVPGVLSSGHRPDCSGYVDGEQVACSSCHPGADFALVLRELTGFWPTVPAGGWRAAGVCVGPKRAVAWRVLDAQYFGVAQRRRRVFIVGCPGESTRAAQVLFEPESCSGDPPPSREERSRTAASLTAGSASGDGVNPPGRRREDDVNLIPMTLNALCANRGQRNDPSEQTLLPVDIRSGSIEGELAHTLQAHNQSYSLHTVPHVLYDATSAFSIYPETGQGSDLVARETDVAPSLSAEGLAKANERKLLVVSNDGSKTDSYSTKLHNTESNQSGKFYREYTPSLQHDSPPPAVVFRKAQKAHDPDDCERWEEADTTLTVDAAGHGPRTATAVIDTVRSQEGMQVRRLTPTECERLQGFPPVMVLDMSMTRDELCATLLALGAILVDPGIGRCWRLRGPGGIKLVEPQELSGSNVNGYLTANLAFRETKKQIRLHRLVWIAANGIPPEGMAVCHRNNIKTDNRIANLYLATHEQNSSDAKADGLYEGVNDNRRKLTDESVKQLLDDYRHGDITMRALAERYGVSKSRIGQIVKMDGWTACVSSDSSRYRLLGNAVCVVVAEWIARRILSVDEARQTI